MVVPRVVCPFLRCCVRLLLNAFPPDYRIALVLVDLQGLDYKEVSKVIGRPLGTVKSRVARARLRMRDHLSQYFETDALPIRIE